jgi:hypothetical protein
LRLRRPSVGRELIRQACHLERSHRFKGFDLLHDLGILLNQLLRERLTLRRILHTGILEDPRICGLIEL